MTFLLQQKPNYKITVTGTSNRLSQREMARAKETTYPVEIAKHKTPKAKSKDDDDGAPYGDFFFHCHPPRHVTPRREYSAPLVGRRIIHSQVHST